MRLLRRQDNGDLHLTHFTESNIPAYAILSHRWGGDHEEVTLEDITNGTGKYKPGYQKIRLCAQQASEDGLEYFWVDTCCIDKANYAELSHSINSMFLWYRNADRCYVYLSDVFEYPCDSDNSNRSPLWELEFRKSDWFRRGWTLQELLAPSTVVFYSHHWKLLGDKILLKHQIREITGIPDSALEGARLSSFTDQERFFWMQERQTKKAVDKAYALLGIFGVRMVLNYDESVENAYKRLEKEIDKSKRCLQDLRLTDPRHDKMRIEHTKGGLLKGSYRWILQNAEFRRWCNSQGSQLLWIKGDPGKGKTMLLCGIIDELEALIPSTSLIAHFFCQATDSRINNSTAVLRGWLYLLIDQQPSLSSHLQVEYDRAGRALFEGTNAWFAIQKVLTNVLQDPTLRFTHLIVDALDECMIERERLLKFIIEQSASPRVKWIISSRNWPDIERQLAAANHSVKLSLELNAGSVATAVEVFIEDKVRELSRQNGYDAETTQAVQHHLSSNADDTFLWVALVCQSLDTVCKRHILKKLSSFPPGLNSLYERMLQQIVNSDDSDLCKEILAVAAIVDRPLTVQEITALIEGFQNVLDDDEALSEIVAHCGSFLTVRENTAYFVHQSAKDFLVREAVKIIAPSGLEATHYKIFCNSIQVLSSSLGKDMYSLGAPGYPIEQVTPPSPDPLQKLRYSVIHWVDHLKGCVSLTTTEHMSDLQDGGAVDMFLRTKYIYWLETLSLCKSLPKGVASMAQLEAIIRKTTGESALLDVVIDAHRFIMYHKTAIEVAPLQTYVSALVFSPRLSLIRLLFEKEEPPWLVLSPPMPDYWSECMQTLEGHRDQVHSVAYSRDSNWLASASDDNTIRVWEANSGACLRILEGHEKSVCSVTFAHDSMRLVSGSHDRTIKIWDTFNGVCLKTLEGHSDKVISVAFSSDSTQVASVSRDRTIKFWDADNGACLRTFGDHSGEVTIATLSYNSELIASASWNGTVKICDTASGLCLKTLNSSIDNISAMAFSDDSHKLAVSRTIDGDHHEVEIWDVARGVHIQNVGTQHSLSNSIAFSRDSTKLAWSSLEGKIHLWEYGAPDGWLILEPSGIANSVVFSHDSMRLASASSDGTVRVWNISDINIGDETISSAFSHDLTRFALAKTDNIIMIFDTTGACIQTLTGHKHYVFALAYSIHSMQLASASYDNTVKIWNLAGACIQTLVGHKDIVVTVAYSHNSMWLASGSSDRTIKIWDVTGACIQTLAGHTSMPVVVAFSHDSMLLASSSIDKQVKVWHVKRGVCLQTIDLDYIARSIRFDTSDSIILTSRGAIDLDLHPPLAIDTLREPISSPGQAITLGTDDWIQYNSANVLWIPSEYRSKLITVSGNKIALEPPSGSRDWICHIDFTKDVRCQH